VILASAGMTVAGVLNKKIEENQNYSKRRELRSQVEYTTAGVTCGHCGSYTRSHLC